MFCVYFSVLLVLVPQEWSVENLYHTRMHARRTHARTHTHTHTFNGPFSGTTRVSQYQKGKTKLDFTEARDSEWQWHQLGHMQVCTSFQTDNHASIPPLSFLQAGCPSCRPTNSVKALKAENLYQLYPNIFWNKNAELDSLILVKLCMKGKHCGPQRFCDAAPTV